MKKVSKDKHLIQIQHKRTTLEKAKEHFENGGTVVAYWSDYPDTGLAYAGECIDRRFGLKDFMSFELQHENAIITIMEGSDKR